MTGPATKGPEARPPCHDNGAEFVRDTALTRAVNARRGHVKPSEIAEAAPPAGLSQTSNVSVGDQLRDSWAGPRLVTPNAADPAR
jgi:hypothetical protein